MIFKRSQNSASHLLPWPGMFCWEVDCAISSMSSFWWQLGTNQDWWDDASKRTKADHASLTIIHRILLKQRWEAGERRLWSTRINKAFCLPIISKGKHLSLRKIMRGCEAYLAKSKWKKLRACIKLNGNFFKPTHKFDALNPVLNSPPLICSFCAPPTGGRWMGISCH